MCWQGLLMYSVYKEKPQTKPLVSGTLSCLVTPSESTTAEKPWFYHSTNRLRLASSNQNCTTGYLIYIKQTLNRKSLQQTKKDILIKIQQLQTLVQLMTNHQNIGSKADRIESRNNTLPRWESEASIPRSRRQTEPPDGRGAGTGGHNATRHPRPTDSGRALRPSTAHTGFSRAHGAFAKTTALGHTF